MKLLLGVKKSTSIMAVYRETGRYPLYISRYVRMIKVWGNVLKTDNIMKTLYNDMFKELKNGPKNWASRIKDNLDMCGFSYVWNNQKTFDFKKIGYLIKKYRIIDGFLQKWYSTVTSSPSLTMYKFLKPQLCYESYLDQLSVKE